MNVAREKILVRGVNWLGDAVMSTPALQRLREAKPNAHITLLTHEKLADLWKSHRTLDAVLTFSKNESAWQVGQKLRGHKFDVGLALPNSHRSALELWFAGIPKRIGYARFGRNFFLTNAVAQREGAVEMRKLSVVEIRQLVSGVRQPTQRNIPLTAHHIFQYLHLVAALGATPEPLAPKIEVAEEEISAFQRRMSELTGNQHGLWLGLNPGAEYGPAKRWPVERFVASAIKLHENTGCGWIIFGANDSATRQVASELGEKLDPKFFVNLAGKTTLRELCAGLKFCKLVLTNDTGPMHIAAAVGTPVVVPFGSTSLELTGPGFPHTSDHALLKSSVPCSPCFLRECPIDFRCMKSIEVDRVVSACLHFLKKL